MQEQCQPTYPKPTAQVAPFYDVLGPEITAKFLLRFGGAAMGYSKSPRADAMLSQTVGLELATALGHAAENLPVRVPLAKGWLCKYLFADAPPRKENWG